jgi:3-dehydroquinate synthase
VVPAGEASKRIEVWTDLLEKFAAAGFDRDLWVCAVGGGVVGDLAGFVAASYLRGVAFVQVPTSLLAMVDASIGGKTGVNLRHGKNLVGAFWQPRAVIADVRALATLPTANLREGVVELYKHALLSGAPWRPAHRGALGFELPASDDTVAWIELIAAAVQVKADIVHRDPLEQGVRAHLNLGHTLAHALEGVTGGTMRHGTAVAYGLLYAALLGRNRGWCDWVAEARALAAWAADAPLPASSWEAIWGYMARDKKRKAGSVRFVLLREIGSPERVADLTVEELQAAWTALPREYLGGTS